MIRHAFIAIVAALALGHAPAHAAFVLDQSNVVLSAAASFDIAVVSSQSVSQTFTVGLQGILAQIDLEIYQSPNTTGDLLFSVRTTSGGLPNPNDAQSLFQSTIPLSVVPTQGTFTEVPLTSIDVSSAGIAVTPGQVLAISLSRVGAGTPPWVLWRQNTGVYAGGGTYLRSGTSGAWTTQPNGAASDNGFRSFVQTTAVPEPSSLALTGMGAVAVQVSLARRRGAKTA